ncbi:FHA domain-containing protein [Hyalangium gracile]|uniref:FHA domain-containing protein n=1 Tax=Hyalangium gracile TaxID=394092 RepID=UPI001CCD2D5A|nr:FHA domain-containing protein [Hyalangium gracile]
MLKLIIEDDEGRKTVVPFVREEITIGRQEGNTIRLTERNVSRRHARLMRLNGHVVVEDLGSSNGTRINGERISGQSPVKDGDLIQIGDYDLALQSDAAVAAAPRAAARPAPAPAPQDSGDADGHSEPETETEAPVEEEAAPASAERRHSTAIIKMEHVEGNRNRKVVELEAEEAPRFVVVSAELKGQEYACIRTEMKIGRTDDNDIVIDHRSLSRTHAKVVREDNGEWKIIDMQSANGLTVNGETYAQAPLSNGDVVELGHVKLRFVGAGESAGSVSSAGRSKLPLVLALGVLLVGGGAGAAWFLKVGPFQQPEQPQKPPELTQEDPVQKPPEPAQPEPPEADPGTPRAPPDTAVADAGKARIQSARKAYEEGKLERAADELKNFAGKLPPEGEELADKIALEQEAAKALEAAQAAFEAKNLDEAESLAGPAKGSRFSGTEYDKLMGAIAQARKAQPKTEPVKVTTPPPNKTPTRTQEDTEEEARLAYNEAATALRGKQYDAALNRALRCVELAPDKAECQMVLGAAYAGVSKWDMAARHYREFLKLAPNHPNATKVRQSVENYEKTKAQ